MLNEHKYEKPVHVRGYRRKDGTYVEPHKSHSVGYEKEYDPEWELDEGEELTEKEYHASAGSAAVLKKYDNSCKKAVKADKFDWVKARKGQSKKSAEYAVCNAAKIATTGKPTVPRGSHFTKGKGPHGKGRHLEEAFFPKLPHSFAPMKSRASQAIIDAVRGSSLKESLLTTEDELTMALSDALDSWMDENLDLTGSNWEDKRHEGYVWLKNMVDGFIQNLEDENE